jgi:hypothetical protein
MALDAPTHGEAQTGACRDSPAAARGVDPCYAAAIIAGFGRAPFPSSVVGFLHGALQPHLDHKAFCNVLQ